MEIHIPITLAAEQAAWEEAQRRLRRKQSAVASKRTEAAAMAAEVERHVAAEQESAAGLERSTT